jgi:hypothetical protein
MAAWPPVKALGDHLSSLTTNDKTDDLVLFSFVLAATEHLHKRISKMGDRIRQLEDALAASHAKNSSEPHPLLRDDLVKVKVEDEEGFLPSLEDPLSGAEVELANPPIEAFGTLSISSHSSRFFGATGGAEVSVRLL